MPNYLKTILVAAVLLLAALCGATTTASAEETPTPITVTTGIKIQIVRQDANGWEVKFIWDGCNSPLRKNYPTANGSTILRASESGASGNWRTSNPNEQVNLEISCTAPDGTSCGRYPQTVTKPQLLGTPDIPRETAVCAYCLTATAIIPSATTVTTTTLATETAIIPSATTVTTTTLATETAIIPTETPPAITATPDCRTVHNDGVDVRICDEQPKVKGDLNIALLPICPVDGVLYAQPYETDKVGYTEYVKITNAATNEVVYEYNGTTPSYPLLAQGWYRFDVKVTGRDLPPINFTPDDFTTPTNCTTTTSTAVPATETSVPLTNETTPTPWAGSAATFQSSGPENYSWLLYLGLGLLIVVGLTTLLVRRR